MVQLLTCLIDGEWLPKGARSIQAVVNPATGQPFAELVHADDQDLDAALLAAERAFVPWRLLSPIERSVILRRAATLLRERIDSIAIILTTEQGKPIAEAKGELRYGADVLDWYAEEGRRAYGRVVPGAAGVRQIVLQEPIGVSLGFTPWNFPALTPCRKIGAALAAGCTIVVKAAEETPGTAIAIAQAMIDAGLPAGVLNLVFGEPARVSSQLIASPISRKISFTGSVAVGKHLTQLAAAGMKRTTMELGGHAPVVVFPDVDPTAVAELLALGKFRNAGQICISPTRFFVHEDIFERFTQRFTEVAAALAVGDGLDPKSRMGPLANPRRIDAMEHFVDDACRRGGRVRTGGRRICGPGFFFEPTVLTDMPDDALIMTDEPFGPVAPIASFGSFDEVIERANSLPLSLASYAFTAADGTGTAIADRLRAGMVGINTLAVSAPETPFGGVGESGHGQEGGVEGLAAFMEVKFVAHAPPQAS